MIDSTLIFAMLILLMFVGVLVYIMRSDARAMREQIKKVAEQQSVIRHNDDVRILCRAIHYLQPGAHAGVDYLVSDDGPDGEPHITGWMHPSIPQPGREEIDRAIKSISGFDPVKDHGPRRSKEYPSVGDQLDAAYKARQGDNSEQVELDRMITRIKEKYPKSDEVL